MARGRSAAGVAGRRLLIDWVDAMCRTWGHQKRWIENRTNADLRPRDPSGFVERKDGFPFSGNASSFAGRYKERVGGIDSESIVVPCPPEVLTGDALKVSCAIQAAIIAKHLTIRQHNALYVQYVIGGPLKAKMDKLRIGRKCFYERLHRAHRVIKPWLRENQLDRDTVTVDGVTPEVAYG